MLHLADIHINTTRHNPKAYQKLFRQINATSRDITVICGDIFDGLATPGDILVFTQLITTMNTPLVLLLGNHDYDMRTPTKTNTMEAILAAYPHTDTHTGAIYTLPNTTIYFATRPGAFQVETFPAVFTLILPNAALPVLENTDWPHVALVHAPTISGQLIAAYDLVLAGDIHVRQFVTPTAAYCGSPLQTNIKEPSNRGGILWDIATLSGTAVNFPSKYGYAKYTEAELVIGYTLPKYPYLVRVESADAGILHKLATRYGISPEICQIIRPFPVVPDAAIASAVYERQQDLQETSVSASLQIRYLAFENIRCYGADNYINFDDLGGLHCLAADNRHGKTSIIYALCVALYGRPPRGELKYVLRGPSGFARCTFTCGGATYTVTHTYRSGRLHGYSLLRNGGPVDIISGGDLADRICDLIGPMSRFLMLFAPLNIRDDFISRPAADQLSAIHAICGHHKYAEWIKAIRKEAAQFLAASKLNMPMPQAMAAADAALQMCLQAKRQYKHAAATSPNTGDSRADLCRQLDNITAAADAAAAEYAAFKSSHTFAPRAADLENSSLAELQQLAIAHISYGTRLMQYTIDKDSGTVPADTSLRHMHTRLNELRDCRDALYAKKAAINTAISATSGGGIHTGEYTRLKDRVATARGQIDLIIRQSQQEHAARVLRAAYMHRVATAHLEMVHAMAGEAFAAFVAGMQDISDTLLCDTVLSLAIRGTETLVVDIITNGVCVSLDAASGFEYTVGSLVLRAAMLKLCGGNLMIIDDATDQISAAMCDMFVVLLRRIAGMLPAVLIITQVEYIQRHLPKIYISRGTFSTIRLGRAISSADTPADCRNNPVVTGAIANYIQVDGGYLCTRCVKRTIVKNPHTRHNKIHE